MSNTITTARSSTCNADANIILENETSNNPGIMQGRSRTMSTPDKIRVGSMVEVARRMWPGINQPGGTARVLGIHTAGESSNAEEDAVIIAVDVHYIVEGRKEKRVPIQYVTHSPQYEAEEEEEEAIATRRGGVGGRRRFLLRDRSQLLGRCKNCGSLRADCGACDWMMIEEEGSNTIKGQRTDPSAATMTTTKSNSGSPNSSNHDTQNSSCNSSSNSSEDDDDDDLLNRRLPMLLSSTNKTKYLHLFLHDQVFGGKTRLTRQETRPRQSHREKSVLETFSINYASDDSGNHNTKNSTYVETDLPTVDAQQLYSISSEDEDVILPKSMIFKRLVKKTALPSQEEGEASLIPNRDIEENTSSSAQTVSNSGVDLEPLSSSQISLYRDYYELGDPDDKLFIQPEAEGEVVTLPNDVLDRTMDLTYDQLPTFFDDLAAKVQHILIPKFQIALVKIQRKKIDMEQQPFLRSLYQQICQELIRDGVDQLTNCLRKICGRRREKNTKLSYQQKKLFKLQNERRDLTLELIGQKVHSLCHDLRESMISTVAATQEENNEKDDEEVQDDGIAEEKMADSGSDDSNSHFKNNLTEFETIADDRLLSDTFDPHPYAYVRQKRRKNITVRTIRNVHHQDFNDLKRHKTNQASNDNEESGEEYSTRKKYGYTAKRSNRGRIRLSSVEKQRNDLSFATSKQSLHDEQKCVREGCTYGADNDTFRDKTGQGSNASRRRRLISCTTVDRTTNNIEQSRAPRNTLHGNQDHQHDKNTATTARILSTRDAVTSYVIPIQATVDHLYQQLRSKNQKEISHSDLGAVPSTSNSIRGSTFNTASTLPDNSNSIDNVLCILHNYLISSNENGHDWMEREDNLKSVFRYIHAQLQHSVSLLEWMHTYDNDDRFIEFLIATFQVIVSIDSQMLDNLQQDSFCQLLCSPKFGDLVIMQIIDVIYSQRLPQVWLSYYFNNETKRYSPLSMKKLSDSSWGKVVQLIALMNQRIPILEAACNVLVKHFKCQQWRITSTEPIRYFVSSVDSNCCRHYFTSGQLVSEGSKRIGSFKKNLPRCEIDNIWAIISTFALRPPFPPKTLMRWQILDLCLFGSNASVFSSMNSTNELMDMSVKTRITLPSYPVDPQHLIVCHKELQFLIDLINCRAVQPFQKSDTFLIKVLQASIHLHVNSVTLDRRFRSDYCKSSRHCSDQDSFEIRVLWEVTDLLQSNGNRCKKKRIIDDIVSRLMQETFDPCTVEKMGVSLEGQHYTDPFELQGFGKMLSMSSGTPMVRIACALLAVWMRHIIQMEDCRAAVLKKSVEELVHRLVTQAVLLEETCKKENVKRDSSNFALLFQEEFNDDSLVAAVCLRESAGFVLFTPCSVIANLYRINDMALDMNRLSSLWTSSEEMRAALWSTVAINSWMQDMQRSLLLGVARVATFYDGPLPILDFSSKVMSGFALCMLQESCFVNSSDEKSLVHVASCIVTSIQGTCDILQSLITQEDIFLGPQKQTCDFFYSPDARQCIKVLSRSCSLLCLILTVARYNSHDKHSASSQLARNIILLSDYGTAVAANKVSRILSLLVASKNLGPEGDICFRSALALMRSAIALSNLHCQMNPDQCSNLDCDGEGSSSLEAFNQITDNDLLNIDIDYMISNASTRRSFDSQGSQSLSIARQRCEPTGVISIDHLWYFLEHSLILSKPSLRFSISQRDEFLLLPPMSDGRALCERQSGGICSVLAALVTFRKHGSGGILKEVFQAIFLSDEKDTCNFHDFTYLKYIRHCLCGEVCRLSHISKSCKSLVLCDVYEFFTIFLDAAVDASCLYEFPTSCLDVMEGIGGKKSRNRERMRLRRLREACYGKKNSAIEHPDLHAFGLNITNDTASDAPGPFYLCRNLWTFGQNLCLAISNISSQQLGQNVNSEELVDLSDILSDSNEEYTMITRDFLDEVKEPSLESECIKRVTKLTRILTFFGLNPTENKIECISTILKSLIEQLNYVTEGYSYQMMTQSDPCSLAKFHILQENYSELVVAVISSIFSCLRPQDLVDSLNVMTFFRDFIFSPSLRGGSIELSKLMRQALQSPPLPCGRTASLFPHVPFSICQTHEKDASLRVKELRILSKAIGFASRRRLREIVLHTALGSFDGKSSLLPVFNELIELATNPSISFPDDESHQQFAVRFGLSLGSLHWIYDTYEPFMHRSGLSNIIDLCLSRVEFSKERCYSLNRQLKALRWQTLQNFLIPKLSIKSAERRKLVLHTLKGLFHSKDQGKNSQKNESSVCLLRGSESNCFVCLYDHICPLIKEISICVKEALASFQIDWELLELLFQCSTSIIMAKVEDGHAGDENEIENSLLHWSHHTFALQVCSSYWQHAKYIYHFSKWMHSLAILLIKTETGEALHRYAFLAKDSSWRNETNDYETPAFLSPMLMTHLDLERDEQILFAKANEILSSRVINVYAKPVVKIIQTTIENRPITSTALGAMNELLVATSFYFS